VVQLRVPPSRERHRRRPRHCEHPGLRKGGGDRPQRALRRSGGAGLRRILGIGLEAKRMLGRTPENIEAVRPLKDGVIADVDVTEMMLRHFLKQVTAKRIFRIKPRVVVGVPSGITELERRAVRSSAMAAGAKAVYMVAEPVAAAIGVGLPIETPTGNMVIDIGGGTTEIAVIALSGIVSEHLDPGGGGRAGFRDRHLPSQELQPPHR
jgi:MreB/Mrl family cell shape determining protein